MQLSQCWYHCLLLGRPDSQQEDTKSLHYVFCAVVFVQKHAFEASVPQTPLLVYEIYHVAHVGLHCAIGPHSVFS